MGKNKKVKKENRTSQQKKYIKTFMEMTTSRMMLISVINSTIVEKDELLKLAFSEIYYGLDDILKKEFYFKEVEIKKALNTKETLMKLFEELKLLGLNTNQNEIHLKDKDVSVIIDDILNLSSIKDFNIIKTSCFHHSIYNRIVSIRRDDFFNGEVISLDEKVQKINSTKEDFYNCIEMIAYMLHLLGLKIFIRNLKVENRHMGKIRIINENIVNVLYSNKKIINDLHFEEYFKTKNASKLFNIFIDNFDGTCSDEYLGILASIAYEYKKYMFFKGSDIKAINISSFINLPLVMGSGEDREFTTPYVELEKLLGTKASKKFAIPVKGVILKFHEDTDLEKAIFFENEDEYVINMKFKEKRIFDTCGSNISEAYFYFTKDNINNMYYIIKENIDSVEPGELLATINDARSHPVEGDDIKMVNDFVKQINYFALTCLFLLHNDIKNNSVIFKNVDSVNYKTTSLRRLPNGKCASSTARNKAIEYGVNIPKGYTIGKEIILN